MGTAFVWDGVGANDWDTDHWGRGGVAPVYPGDAGSDPSDTIEINGTSAEPATQPGVLTVASYKCYGGSFDCGANLTVTDTLEMGTAAGADAPVFSGDASAVDGAIFQGAAINEGLVGQYATFGDTSANHTGSVSHYPTFNDTATNAGTVGDYTTFNDAAWNDGGTCGDEATFNSTATEFGTFNGSLYHVKAPTDFDATAILSGGPPVVFELMNAAAKVTGVLSSDWLGTPAQVEIAIAAQADLAAANILAGKTILGVAGTLDITADNPPPAIIHIGGE